jgi:FKBP-type peptidyl-prolyl cis-trans isomerase
MPIVFHDPSFFQEKLRSLSSVESDGLPTVTTQVAPAGDTTQRNADGSVKAGRSVTTAATDQRVTVQQLQAPRVCKRGATTDDLMEISYTGSVLETGQVFDGSAVFDWYIGTRKCCIPLFCAPPGWDVGLLGMCVGERRRLILPPSWDMVLRDYRAGIFHPMRPCSMMLLLFPLLDYWPYCINVQYLIRLEQFFSCSSPVSGSPTIGFVTSLSWFQL